ncbi:MAG: EscU/YscU/HrcU family type III secretion system export apparatus switch protein [Gammaproteobacteria bacterium]|nr:EscU/YscU/HrcU family type III secretion system export apparatus switch protein [Gammaproteobacteria bacterium]
MNDPGSERTVTLAVALQYDELQAPRVTAKGSGDLAQQILEIARRHRVPLQENSELVKLLSNIELGDQIPQSLYLAVAEVIAFAYLLKGKVPANWRAPEFAG